MTNGFKFHHIGVAVVDMEQAVAFYSHNFGLKMVSGPFDDPIQQVKVCFLELVSQNLTPIELICPLNDTSPVNGYLSKGIGAYHVCFEVEEIGETLNKLWKNGCVVVSQPAPAVAFAGRKIAWCFTPTRQLVELVEGSFGSANPGKMA